MLCVSANIRNRVVNPRITRIIYEAQVMKAKTARRKINHVKPKSTWHSIPLVYFQSKTCCADDYGINKTVLKLETWNLYSITDYTTLQYSLLWLLISIWLNNILPPNYFSWWLPRRKNEKIKLTSLIVTSYFCGKAWKMTSLKWPSSEELYIQLHYEMISELEAEGHLKVRLEFLLW